jgi:hypothetical protein
MSEHANIMLEMQLTDLNTFKWIYENRVGNILHNNVIKEKKLKKEAESWQNFIHLCHKLGLGKELKVFRSVD